MMVSIIWMTLALLSIAGEIMGEECFKIEPTDRKIPPEYLEELIVRLVATEEWRYSMVGTSQPGPAPFCEPRKVGQTVAELMASTRDKLAKPDFLKGYTVDQLLKVNTWEHEDDCIETELQRRTTICSAFNGKSSNKFDRGVETYCSLALAEMRSSCAKWLYEKKSAEFKQVFGPYYEEAEKLHSKHDYSQKSILTRMDRKDANELISYCKSLFKSYKFIGLTERHQDWDDYWWQCEAIKSVKLNWFGLRS